MSLMKELYEVKKPGDSLGPAPVPPLIRS